MYINIKTKEIISRQELEDRHRDPYVTFPEDAVDAVLLEFGYANVNYKPMPVVNSGQIVTQGSVEQTFDGYFYTWVVTDRVIAKEEVDAERDRRVDAGVTYNGHLFQSRQGDRENITGASQLAMMAIMNGAVKGDYRWANADRDFAWITDDNEIVNLDAFEVFELGRAAATSKQTMIFAARVLKDMEVIPTDFTEDKWWV
jgi:hypothetical protein